MHLLWYACIICHHITPSEEFITYIEMVTINSRHYSVQQTLNVAYVIFINLLNINEIFNVKILSNLASVGVDILKVRLWFHCLVSRIKIHFLIGPCKLAESWWSKVYEVLDTSIKYALCSLFKLMVSLIYQVCLWTYDEKIYKIIKVSWHIYASVS